jgi:hypothetical protein
MTIDTNNIPALPSRNQAGFSDQVDAFITWFLNTFPSEFNDSIEALNLNDVIGSSSTSNSVGTGAKTFTANTAKSWQPGMWVLIADTAAPSTNYMAGPVTSYNSGTGSLVVNVAVAVGSGTKTAWTISQSAPGGATLGANSYTGTQSFAKGADVASAATTNVWTTDGNLVHVTGTTGITSLGTAPQAGAFKLVIFDGVLTLTHSANLNLPDSENFTTEAGDMALVVADTTTQLDVLFFRKLPAATATKKGIVELLTEAEYQTGTDAGRVLTAAVARNQNVYEISPGAQTGTAIDFTGIPAWAKVVMISLEGNSTSGTSLPIFQLGDAGGIEATGYLGYATVNSGGASPSIGNPTTGFGLTNTNNAAATRHGLAIFTRSTPGSNTWVYSYLGGRSDTNVEERGGGSKSLSAPLDRIRYTTAGGVETIDAGTLRAFAF